MISCFRIELRYWIHSRSFETPISINRIPDIVVQCPRYRSSPKITYDIVGFIRYRRTTISWFWIRYRKKLRYRDLRYRKKLRYRGWQGSRWTDVLLRRAGRCLRSHRPPRLRVAAAAVTAAAEPQQPQWHLLAEAPARTLS
jgi:hypothetical protein